MKILLHSSKTMKPELSKVHGLTTPQFMDQAVYIIGLLRTMDKRQLASLMEINERIAEHVQQQIHTWADGAPGSAAALAFRGDIYSGLAASGWHKDDAAFAQEHLVILSGLYGLLRPYDQIKSYRLEMGYKLKLNGLRLDKFWEQELTNRLDASDTYINLTAKEYFKVIERQLAGSSVISPKFLTVSQKTKLPVFVTVHTKIARGSFANWLITNKIDDPEQVTKYDQLNYRYDETLSSPGQPVFVCQKFCGLGLSVRLK